MSITVLWWINGFTISHIEAAIFNIHSFSNRCRYLFYENSPSEFIVSLKLISLTLFCMFGCYRVVQKNDISNVWVIMSMRRVLVSIRLHDQSNPWLKCDYGLFPYFHLVFDFFFNIARFCIISVLFLLKFVHLLWSVCCCIIFVVAFDSLFFFFFPFFWLKWTNEDNQYKQKFEWVDMRFIWKKKKKKSTKSIFICL